MRDKHLYKVHGTKNGKRVYLGAIKAHFNHEALSLARGKFPWCKDLAVTCTTKETAQ